MLTFFSRLFTRPGQVYGRNFSAVRAGLTVGAGVGLGVGAGYLGGGNAVLRTFSPKHELAFRPVKAAHELKKDLKWHADNADMYQKLIAAQAKKDEKKEAAEAEIIAAGKKSGKKGESAEA